MSLFGKKLEVEELKASMETKKDYICMLIQDKKELDRKLKTEKTLSKHILKKYKEWKKEEIEKLKDKIEQNNKDYMELSEKYQKMLDKHVELQEKYVTLQKRKMK